MLRVSDEAAIKCSKDLVELREALERINSKILQYEEERNYIYNEKSYINYCNLLSLQREAKIKVRKYTKPRS